MKHLLTVVLTTLVLSVVPGEVQAQAQPAFTARTVNVRAGPGRDYPRGKHEEEQRAGRDEQAGGRRE